VNSFPFEVSLLVFCGFQLYLDELQAQVDNQTTGQFAKRRAEIELNIRYHSSVIMKNWSSMQFMKLKCWQGFRKDFHIRTGSSLKLREEDYFKLSLTKQVLGIDGAVGSLENMGYVL